MLRARSSVGEHLVCNQGVAGSNPAGSTTFRRQLERENGQWKLNEHPLSILRSRLLREEILHLENCIET